MPSGSRIVLRVAAEADIPTPDTGQTALFMDADDGNAPAYKDDGGTVTPLQGTPGADGADAPPLTYLDHGNTGSTETIDASAADVQRLVLNAATVTLTLTGAPASGTPCVIRLWLEQDGTGGRDIAWPGSVDFGVAGEPDWTTRGSGDVDLVDLMTVDGGTSWQAVIAGRAGPQGDPGADGADGMGSGTITTVEEVDGSPTDSAITKIVFPNGTVAIASHVATVTPPGYEYDYVEVSSGNVSITHTSEAAADTIVTANAVSYDGSTKIMIEFFCVFGAPPAGNVNIVFVLYDGSTSLGKWGQFTNSDGTNAGRIPIRLSRRLTPSNASHTYSVRAYVDSGTGTVNNGAGGSGNYMPLFIRQTKV